MDGTQALLFYFFIAIATINVAFYLFYTVFAFTKIKANKTVELPAVSIIICAKNEEINLSKNVPKILDQDYPNFEVILINDGSSDGTEKVMKAFEAANNNIKYVKVESNERFWGKKKYALTLGIKKATYKHLLFTDADCYPLSKQWVRQMVSSFGKDKSVVLGYGAYAKVKGSLVNKMIRFETVITAIQYFSYAISGRPYMGVGRNLAYTADLFYEHKGFVSHMDVLSGDDDLFINEAANQKNTMVQLAPSSYTISEPHRTFKSWIYQKRRHLTTAQRYKIIDQFLLGLFYISQLFFIIGSIVLLNSGIHIKWVLGIIGLRYCMAWLSVGMGSYRLGERDVAWLFPFLEFFLIALQLSIFMANKFSKVTRWN